MVITVCVCVFFYFHFLMMVLSLYDVSALVVIQETTKLQQHKKIEGISFLCTRRSEIVIKVWAF